MSVLLPGFQLDLSTRACEGPRGAGVSAGHRATHSRFGSSVTCGPGRCWCGRINYLLVARKNSGVRRRTRFRLNRSVAVGRAPGERFTTLKCPFWQSGRVRVLENSTHRGVHFRCFGRNVRPRVVRDTLTATARDSRLGRLRFRASLRGSSIPVLGPGQSPKSAERFVASCGGSCPRMSSRVERLPLLLQS